MWNSAAAVPAFAAPADRLFRNARDGPDGRAGAGTREHPLFPDRAGAILALDFVFCFVFIAVLLAYSWKLTLIVLASIPLYFLIGFLVRPPLREKVKKFNRGAASQQFLVETVVGMQTVKSAAVEPLMQAQWEERLAAYVRTGFEAQLMGAGGQQAIQYVSKLTTALLLLFGAYAVIHNDLTVAHLSPSTLPTNRAADSAAITALAGFSASAGFCRAARRYPQHAARARPRDKRCAAAAARRDRGQARALSLSAGRTRSPQTYVRADPRRRGRRHRRTVRLSKSTLTKLIQRLYIPKKADYARRLDLSQVDPAWLRSHIGVVLQENILFNRTIHDISLSHPAMHARRSSRFAKLTRRRRVHLEAAAWL
jgi:subfamily B ATP-binding cassette protein HlyB/CyaB